MASFTNSCLALGVLSSTSVINVITAVADKKLIHNFWVFNNYTSDITLKVYRYNGTTQYQLIEILLATKKHMSIPIPAAGWVIETGHMLRLQASVSSYLNYAIDGAIEV